MSAQKQEYAALTCQHCNAHLRIDASQSTVTCEYCGATYLTSDFLPADDAEDDAPMPRPAFGHGPTPEQKRKRLISIIVVLVVMFLLVRCTVNVTDSSSASSSASASASASAPAASSASSSSSASASSAANAITITPAAHSNSSAVTPAFKQQVDDLEEELNSCLQKIADGDKSMEPYLQMALALDEFDSIDDSNLSSADKTYLRETLVHMASNVPAVLGDAYQLNLGSNISPYFNGKN